MDKTLSMLGICRRAGKLSSGFDQVVEELKSGKAQGAVVASDISEKTKKNISFFCEEAGKQMLCIPQTQMEISAAVGKRAGVFSVSDGGLFEAVRKTLI